MVMVTIPTLLSWLLLLTPSWIGVLSSGDDFPVINISQGAVKGRKVNSTVAASFYSFQGIPYAKPPLGDLRFRPPVPADSWNGTYDATYERGYCKQPSSLARAVLGDEDCLYINVYVPELPGSDTLLPVMVWIHGGAFVRGSSNQTNYGPEFILNEGVVYVSMNYRIGVLGFLSTADEVVPGNLGLKDQVLALRWVQENIEAFGGDPAKVTIFGQSAGGTSVALQVVSPMSAGLFRAAIAHSGSATDQLGIRDNPRETAFFLGKTLGFTGNSTQELVDFLRTVSADDLVTAGTYSIPESDAYRLMKIDFVPSVEPVIEGEEAFLTDNPINLIAEGKFTNVPFITGTVSGEGIWFISDVIQGFRTTEEVNEDFLQTFKPELRYCKKEACGDELVAKIKTFYFEDQPVSNATLMTLIDMVTDMFFAEGVMYGVEKMSSLSTAPVYLYYFSYEGGLARNKVKLPGAENIPGVCHGDDLGYLFYIGLEPSEGSKDAEVRSEMVTIWTNFAKTLNPTPESTDNIPIWPQYTNSSTSFLEIGSEVVVKTEFHKQRLDFWKTLYSPYSPK